MTDDKIKIGLGGGRRLGVKVLSWLCTQEWADIAAVCPVPLEYDPYYHEMMQIIQKNKLKILDISDFDKVEIDLGLSVNYHKIINGRILEHCRKGFYNVHHSYNLRLRGRNITTHAILNTLKENIYYHGTCIHKMVPELDAGPIVATSSVEINSSDTAFSLFDKVDEEAFELVKTWLPRISFQTVFMYLPPIEGVHIYKNSDLPDKLMNLDEMSDREIDNYVRAFDFPGKEPAYYIKDERKHHLVINMRDSFQSIVRIGTGKYYTEF